MINEISQNTAGILSLQSKGGSSSVSRTQEQSAVEASNLQQLPKQVESKENTKPQSQVVNEKEIEEAVDDLNQYAQTVQRQLEFTVDKDSGKTIIKVVDAKTGETIRDIPPEEIVNMQKHLKETSERMFHKEGTAVSLLFQGKA
ncbi:MAG: flagellar protein FlaG [Sedimenticola sp.]|nr:flagellar protein FlaG [Sedimenticola sp.]